MDRPVSTDNSSSRRGVTGPATLAIVGVGWWVATVGLMHVLKPETGIAGHAMSEYAIGRYGWLMTVAFVAVAAGQMAFAVALARGLRPSGWVAPVLFGVAGLESVMEAVFRADGNGPVTTQGSLHVLFGVTSFVLSIIAMFVLVRRFRRDPVWQGFARPTQLWAFTSLVALLSVPAFGQAHQGIGQRVFVPVLLSWVVATAVRLRRLGAGTVPQTSSTRIDRGLLVSRSS